MEFIRGKVTFQCRKCGHLLIHDVPKTEAVCDLVNCLQKISKKDCPGCGEEPYENWYLAEVKIWRAK